MDYKTVKQKLKDCFLAVLKLHQFTAKTGSQGCLFIKRTSLGANYFSYGVTNYIDEFKTGSVIGLRNNQIQNALSNILNDPEIYNSGTGTISYRYADYLGVVNFDFIIRTDEDIDRWIVESEKFIREFALPFYERYKTVDAIDKLLNEKPRERLVYAQFSERIIRGLVAANLNANPRYEELLEVYWDEVEIKIGLDNFQTPKIKKVMDFLRTHTRDEIIKLSLTDEKA